MNKSNNTVTATCIICREEYLPSEKDMAKLNDPAYKIHPEEFDFVCNDEACRAMYAMRSPFDPLFERKCRVCGCTDLDCSGCVEKTGHPCHWVEEDLCSACAPKCEIKGCEDIGWPCLEPCDIDEDPHKEPGQTYYHYYCSNHAFGEGFCYMCGSFSTGRQGFDFGNGLCPECRDELASECGEFDDDSL